MLISYKWLQTYFDQPLPAPEVLGQALTFGVFEIEGIQKTEIGDTVLDVKVLPDRAHYALSHAGMAYEVSAITGLPLKALQDSSLETMIDTKVKVTNEAPELCGRYMARFVTNVNVGESPAWLKERLAAIGQRSINNVVDATNFVMFDVGQPLHAFDADKVVGGITIRSAKPGETITTLDNKTVNLDITVLVIADDAGPLAIAGIKGGNRAAVDTTTKNIIIESANFAAGMVRKTSQKIGIRTDSSKRFENELSPETAKRGMEAVTNLITEIATTKNVGPVTDIYPKPQQSWSISVAPSYINERLGITINTKTIIDLLNRLQIKVEDQGNTLTITPPSFRLDLTIPQDIVEEVGRLYGYDKIPEAKLPETSFKPAVVKSIFYSDKIKNFLITKGFSEVYTYSLTDHGEFALANPMAADKNSLRTSLDEGITKSLELNGRNVPLLGLDEVKIFEIGTVFTKEKGERTQLGLGAYIAKSIKNKDAATKKILEDIQTELATLLGTNVTGTFVSNDRLLIDLTELLTTLPDHSEYEPLQIPATATIFKPISPYPFIIRDIAVFTTEGTTQADVEQILTKNAGPLMVRLSLFDVFTKPFPDGTKKTSYAFRLIFQSNEQTLTDAQINSIMDTITKELNSRPGWQVR